jgi:hypothetical protein
VTVLAPGGPSPLAVQVTVARLDRSSTWRRFTTDAAGPAWVRLDERLADADAVDAWYRAELVATARHHPDLAGALIVYRLAGALAELVVGCLVDQGRCVDLTPAGVSLRFGDAARLDELSVASPTVAVLPDDAAAGDPGTHVASSTGELADRAVDGLVAVFAPVADAVRSRAPFGLRGMWGTLADHLAEVAVGRARERGRAVEGPCAAASALIDRLAERQPLVVARPRRQDVHGAAGTGAFVVKGTCCLVYKAAGPPPGAVRDGSRRAMARRAIDAAACASCPLRSEDDRHDRFAAYLAHRAGARPSG